MERHDEILEKRGFLKALEDSDDDILDDMSTPRHGQNDGVSKEKTLIVSNENGELGK